MENYKIYTLIYSRLFLSNNVSKNKYKAFNFRKIVIEVLGLYNASKMVYRLYFHSTSKGKDALIEHRDLNWKRN